MPGRSTGADVEGGAGSETGRVFDISRCSVHDGPGLRTVVYLKGCPLRCPWCHNPEGQSPSPQIAFRRGRCIGCGRCQRVCPRGLPLPGTRAGMEGCQGCGLCAEACPSRARQLVGRSMSVSELVAAATREIAFIRGTGGGVTFSGGEPLAQPEFLLACSEALQAMGVHVAVETAGQWPAALVEELASRVDLVLFDLKHVDPEKWREAVGPDPSRPLSNLRRLLMSGAEVELRVTLVPGFNDGEDDLRQIEEWLEALPHRPPVRWLHLHRLARAKEAVFGRAGPSRSRSAWDRGA